jgi:hypothetical protein
MNQREPTSSPQGVGQAIPCLALLLLPLLSGVCAAAHPHLILQAGLTQQKPYLVVLGAPPLRFQDPAPAADLAVRPPIPGALRASSTELPSNSVEPISRPDAEIASTSRPSVSPANSPTKLPLEPESVASAPTRTPPPILPDEMRPQARAEDFLPFFQIPAGQSGELNVIVPVPRAPTTPSSLQSSSATYTQSPR